MSQKNQITVTFDQGCLKIVNTDTDPVNVEGYKSEHIISVSQNFHDFTTLNAYQPGHSEFDTVFEVALRILDYPNPVKFDLNNVTNQPTWTLDQAGLTQAIDDIKAFINGSLLEDIPIPQLDLSTAGAVTDIDIPFTSDDPWSIQFIWAGLDFLDGTIDLLSSNDGINFDTLDNFTTITMTPAADSATVDKDDFSFTTLRITITKNSVTTGTLDFKLKK